MRVEILSNRSTKWETLVRATVKEASANCTEIDGFIRYFDSVLKDRKRETTGYIHDSYKAMKVCEYVQIYHTPASGNDRIIAVVYPL